MLKINLQRLSVNLQKIVFKINCLVLKALKTKKVSVIKKKKINVH